MNFEVIYDGWMNNLNYSKLSEEQKKLIDKRAKICIGAKGDLTDKCEYFLYSPVYAFVEKVIAAPRKIWAYINSKSTKDNPVYEYIEHPNGVTEQKKVKETTGEVIGYEGYRCDKCGCPFSAKISVSNKIASKEGHCPLNKW